MEMGEQMREISSRECSPVPPPILGLTASSRSAKRFADCRCCMAGADPAGEMWDRLFAEGYLADVCVYTNDGVVPAHASILGMASPVMKNMLKQSKSRARGRWKPISIRGVPHHAVRVFLRFLYTSCYEQAEMNQYVFHLLVLSHVFAVPSLKKVCVKQLEMGLLNVENVVDAYQLSQLCDAPCLRLHCHRMIVKRFKEIYVTEGWKVMRQCNPELEKELIESVIDEDSRKIARLRKLQERRIYLQLHEAMEALIHICRDGCRTIGPHDKVLRQNAAPCNFPACKGLEALVRHFAGCKNRVLGSCTLCKRMWQLLELHSRLCAHHDRCKVPLCGQFKDKLHHQNKKDEVKWKLLVSKVLEAKKFSTTPMLPSIIDF